MCDSGWNDDEPKNPPKMPNMFLVVGEMPHASCDSYLQTMLVSQTPHVLSEAHVLCFPLAISKGSDQSIYTRTKNKFLLRTTTGMLIMVISTNTNTWEPLGPLLPHN